MPKVKKGLRGICRHCSAPFTDNVNTARYCVPCRAFCTHCFQKPRTAHSYYCADCKRDWQRAYYDNFTPEMLAREQVRNRINKQIRAGKRERLPCLICNKPKTQVFVIDAEREEINFLCRLHHAEMSTMYGRAKGQERRGKKARPVFGKVAIEPSRKAIMRRNRTEEVVK